MVIAAASVNGVCATAGIDRVGSIAACNGVVTGATVNEQSIVRTGGGDGIACGTGNDALKIIGNSSADISCLPASAGVGSRNSCVAVAVVEGVVFGAKGDRAGDRTCVVEVEGIVQFAKVEVDGTTA